MADEFDLSSLIGPMGAAGLDPNDPEALAKFTKMQGGGATALPGGVVATPRDSAPAAPATRPLAKPVVPGTVTPSGESQSTADDLAAQARSETALQSAEAKRAQDLRDPATGKLLDQYRPTIGQRIVRGLRGAALGLAGGGIKGAIAGAVDPATTRGGQDYGAPNKAGQQELRREDSDIAIGQQSLAEQARRFKERQQADVGEAAIERARAAQERAEAAANKGEKEPTTRDAFAIRAAETLHPGDPEAQQKYLDEHGAGEKGSEPKTPEGVVADAAYKLFPNDPQKRVAYMQKNGIVSPDTAARIAEAQAAHADAMANAAQRHDDAMATRETNQYMRYQSQLLRYGQDKTALDTKVQGEWDKYQREYDKDRGKAEDAGDQDAIKKIDARYAQRKTELQNTTNGWYRNLKEPQAPSSLSNSTAAPAGGNARPAPQNNQPKVPTKADIPKATQSATNPKTKEKAYLINGQWYPASQLR